MQKAHETAAPESDVCIPGAYHAGVAALVDDPNDAPHFWAQGRQDVIERAGGPAAGGRYRFDLRWEAAVMSAEVFRAEVARVLFGPCAGDGDRWRREGMSYTITPPQIGAGGYEFAWQPGAMADDERSIIAAAVNAPDGWARAGVFFPAATNGLVVVSVVDSSAQTPCGGQNTIGCYSWDGRNKPQIQFLRSALRGPLGKGLVLHEFGHACFRLHDMYANHGQYRGVMGAGASGNNTPTEVEIENARLWLAGRAPNVHQH